MDTIFLNPDTWDWELDSSGNIKTATGGYALAQDAASEIKTFQGEIYYDTTRGIPYWQNVLGQFPPVSLLKAYFNQAALNVPEVVSAVSFIAGIQNRVVSGQCQVRNAAGTLKAVNFFSYSPEVIALET
jgi:hypothetical protein